MTGEIQQLVSRCVEKTQSAVDRTGGKAAPIRRKSNGDRFGRLARVSGADRLTARGVPDRDSVRGRSCYRFSVLAQRGCPSSFDRCGQRELPDGRLAAQRLPKSYK